MNALVFGAGNIGRGFLGERLSHSGHAVTFVDASPAIVDSMNVHREYPVFVVGTTVSEIMIRGVKAILASDVESIIAAVIDADIILTAVGKDQLPKVAPALAQGLLARLQKRPRSTVHVVVVACENAEENTSSLLREVLQRVPVDVRDEISGLMSFPNCVVDRIAPNADESRRHHPLAVVVEQYFQFVIDGTALRQSPPSISGLVVSNDLRAVLDQKLFTLNMAHALIAYWGYLHGCEYIHEAISERGIRALVHGALAEVELVLIGLHASITVADQRRYVGSIIRRFENVHLGDQVTRVARDPRRKLSSSDRLVRPATVATQAGHTPAYLAAGIAAALHYDFASDQQAKELVQAIREEGVGHVLAEVSGIGSSSTLHRLVEAGYLLRAL